MKSPGPVPAAEHGTLSLPRRLRLRDRDQGAESQGEDLVSALQHPGWVGAQGKERQEMGKMSLFFA